MLMTRKTSCKVSNTANSKMTALLTALLVAAAATASADTCPGLWARASVAPTKTTDVAVRRSVISIYANTHGNTFCTLNMAGEVCSN